MMMIMINNDDDDDDNNNNNNYNNNNKRIYRTPFHVKHAQLRWTGVNTKRMLYITFGAASKQQFTMH